MARYTEIVVIVLSLLPLSPIEHFKTSGRLSQALKHLPTFNKSGIIRQKLFSNGCEDSQISYSSCFLVGQ
jgi:hypothetical protein